MALRRFAGEVTTKLGLRVQPFITPEATPFSLRIIAERAYTTAVDGLKYASSHEWAKIEGDSATVGISEFAQQELGDIVFVELPEVGSKVEKGKNFGVVESVKAASDVYSPLSGEVTEVNEKLAEEPQQVNTDAFGEGWLMKIKLDDSSEAADLLDKAAYEKHCEENSDH